MGLDGLSGLASGVDTSAIVDQLMALERRGKTRLTLRQSAFSDQTATLNALKTKLTALRTAASDLRSVLTWGETQAVESSDPTRVVVARTGGAPIGGYGIQVLGLASSAQKSYTWTESAAASQLDFGGGKLVDVAANAKVTDVAATINGRGDLPVYAAVVGQPGAQKLVLSTRATGVAATFSVTGSQLSAPVTETDGRDASYLLDGDVVPRSSPTNVLESAIPGVRITLKGVTSGTQMVTVGAPSVDREKVKTEVKEFVEAYNAVVNAARTELTEKKVKDATTTADYVKGQFFGDSGLSAMLSKLRSSMSETFGTGTYNDLSDIGVSVPRAGQSKDSARAGTLTLDETKLMDALNADAQGVRALLGGTTAPGFGQKIDEVVDSLAKVLEGRIASVGKQSSRVSTDMTRMDERLAAKEKRMKAQFAAMEAALQQSQTQGAWLQGQLAGLPTWQ